MSIIFRSDIYGSDEDTYIRAKNQKRFIAAIRRHVERGARIFRAHFPNPRHSSHDHHDHLVELCAVNFYDVKKDRTSWVIKWLSGPSADKFGLMHSLEFRAVHPLRALAVAGIDAHPEHTEKHSR